MYYYKFFPCPNLVHYKLQLWFCGSMLLHLQLYFIYATKYLLFKDIKLRTIFLKITIFVFISTYKTH
jgi:hypothetical protein